jgi:molecular chaperone DnaK (HSP70)
VKLGVDFGTTRTIVAYADRGNYPVLSFFDAAGDAHDHFPSIVAERGGELLFGFAALEQPSAMSGDARDKKGAVVRSFKRLLSDAHAVPDKSVVIGSMTIGLGELVTRFLVALKEAILTRSNLPKELRARARSVRSAIGVPANAHAAQRLLTLDAFRRAGFEPKAMHNEPSAAGFEYTHRHRDTLTSKREHVVVYDLGGGTFDASLVRMRGATHEVLATAGVNRLGGDDFDEALAEVVLARAGGARRAVAPDALARLLDQCRDAKERLNPSSRKISIDLEEALGDAAPVAQIAVTVADFYDACAPLVARSLEAMEPVMARLEGDADAPDDLAGIYVVGGASELPIVARTLRQRFGRRVHRSPYPSAAIAIGLAIACDESAAFALTDRCTRTFGVFRESAAGCEITFDPIFTSDTLIPDHGAPVVCRRDYRAAHNVGHFRFFECAALGADGRPRGDMVLSGDVLFPFDASLRKASNLAEIPVQRSTGGPRIEEEYALDEHGIVAITIRDVDGGFEQSYTLGA